MKNREQIEKTLATLQESIAEAQAQSKQLEEQLAGMKEPEWPQVNNVCWFYSHMNLDFCTLRWGCGDKKLNYLLMLLLILIIL